MLAAQYDLLLTYNNITNKEERRKNVVTHVEESLLRNNKCIQEYTAVSESKASENRSPSCEILSSIKYLRAFKSEPPSYIFRALFTGWGSLFFAGGAGRLQKYLGLEAEVQPYMFDSNVFRGFYSLFPFLLENARHAGSFFSIFIPVTTFSIITRLFGVVGLIALLRKKSNIPILTFHLFTLITLTASCMFYSMVRDRAPMEPILMLFSSIGISTLLDSLRRKFRSTGSKRLIK